MKEKEKELNTLLNEKKHLRNKQKQLLNRLEEEQALSKIDKDIQELGPDNQIRETLRGIIATMKGEEEEEMS